MATTRPVLAITMGDPAGIGPEVVILAIDRPEVREGCRPLVVGDAQTLERACRIVGSLTDVRPILHPDDARFDPTVIEVVQIADVPASGYLLGVCSAEAGHAAYQSFALAVELALSGAAAAVVTAPLNKEALNLAGHRYAGHTEMLRELCAVDEAAMLLWSDALRVVHVTDHVALAQVTGLVRRDRVVAVTRLGHEAARRMGIDKPRIALAGMNPHAGEGGLFGDEDAREIGPAAAELRAEGIDATGPYPPDTIFLRASKGEFDLVTAMYHDQGHIAVKMVGFESAINITLGLPLVRTSPDHGTAFDIAGTGRASPSSMVAALRAAWLLAGSAR